MAGANSFAVCVISVLLLAGGAAAAESPFQCWVHSKAKGVCEGVFRVPCNP